MFIETLGIDSKDLSEQFLKQRILGAGREEGKTIEYKKNFEFTCDAAGNITWKGDNKDSQYEFLKDVSSFANASGGVIFYGIRAPSGIPIEITGLNIPKNTFELVENHLDDLIRDHIEPPMTVGYHHISLENKKEVYLFIIPQSWTGPHQVVFEQPGKTVHKEFWARSDAKKKYQLGVGQLRDAFVRSKTLVDEIAQFKADRIKFASESFAADESPLNGDAMTLLHLIPIRAFDSENRPCDINLAFRDDNALEPMFRTGDVGFPGPDSRIWPRFNFDGVKKCCYYVIKKRYEADTPARTILYLYTYSQLFANGIVEAAERIKLNTEKYMPNPKTIDMDSFERELIDTLSSYIKTIQKLGVAPRIFLFMTLRGVKGYEISRRRSSSLFGRKIDRDILEIAALPIDTYDIKPETILKPCFDSIWNACGYPESLNYNEDGEHDVRGSDQRLQKLLDQFTEK